MKIFRDSEASVNNEDISRFLSDCGRASGGEVLDFSLLQQVPLIRYSASYIILRWNDDKQDFIIKYWGSHLTEVYGEDMTGCHVEEVGPVEIWRYLVAAHREVMLDQKKVYLGGQTDWREKDHQCWYQVMLPLSRDGQISETLTFVTFE